MVDEDERRMAAQKASYNKVVLRNERGFASVRAESFGEPLFAQSPGSGSWVSGVPSSPVRLYK